MNECVIDCNIISVEVDVELLASPASMASLKCENIGQSTFVICPVSGKWQLLFTRKKSLAK